MKAHACPVSAVEQAMLDGVSVRLIRPKEQARFDELIERKHYLHSAAWVGERLFYVAEHEGQWVALLAWTAAAYHLKGRERWIGWTDRQRNRRLSLVANNSRYLILLSAGRCPNLASRVMRLCLDRLSEDWVQRYGHPIWIVESFVDGQLFRGTSYKASGWEQLGLTAGWSRGGEDFYVAHDRPKQLWVRELRAGARTRLRGKELPAEASMVEADALPECEQTPEQLGGIRRYFEGVSDWRRRVGPYPCSGLIALVACATLCGVMRGQRDLAAFARTLTQAQLQALNFPRHPRGRGRPYRVPAETTLFRLLSHLDWHELEAALLRWQEDRLGPRPDEDRVVAYDGKELRSSQGIAAVNAYAVRSGRWLGSEPVADKSNEIPAARELFKRIDMNGQIVALDALHTNAQTASQIVFDSGGDYLLRVKGNQPGIAETLEQLKHGLDHAFSPSEGIGHDRAHRVEPQSCRSTQPHAL